LTIAEIVSELVDKGRTLQEIAGLDFVQLRWIFFRERNEDGSLKRPQVYEPRITKPVSYEQMFRDHAAKFMDAAEVEKTWQDWLNADDQWEFRALRQRQQEALERRANRGRNNKGRPAVLHQGRSGHVQSKNGPR
jgi:hypothetical protein